MAKYRTPQKQTDTRPPTQATAPVPPAPDATPVPASPGKGEGAAPPTPPLTIIEHLEQAEALLAPIMAVHGDNTSLNHGNMILTTQVTALIRQGLEQIAQKGVSFKGM